MAVLTLVLLQLSKADVKIKSNKVDHRFNCKTAASVFLVPFPLARPVMLFCSGYPLRSNIGGPTHSAMKFHCVLLQQGVVFHELFWYGLFATKRALIFGSSVKNHAMLCMKGRKKILSRKRWLKLCLSSEPKMILLATLWPLPTCN